MSEPWVRTALSRLPSTTACPSCGFTLAGTTCQRCGVALTDDRAMRVYEASQAAATALSAREVVLVGLRREAHERRAAEAARVRSGGSVPASGAPVPVPSGPQGPQPVAAAAPAPAPASATPAVVPTSVPAASAVAPVPAPAPAGPGAVAAPAGAGHTTVPRPAPRIGLQQVLAAAGAGLVAVSAVVFVFFTFEDSLGLRALVTGLVTVGAGAVAAVLRRQGLGATGESLGTLAVVLLLVDVELILTAVGPGAATGLGRALLYAGVCAALIRLARPTRLVSWAVGGILLVPVVPVLAGFAGVPLSNGEGRVSSASVALGFLLSALSTRLAERTGARATRGSAQRRVATTLVALRGIAYGGAVGMTALLLVACLLSSDGDPVGRLIASGLLLAGAATAAVLARGAAGPRWWSAVGAGVVLASAVLPAAGPWALATVPAAGLVAWLALGAVVRRLPTAAWSTALTSGAVVQAMTAVAGAGVCIALLVEAPVRAQVGQGAAPPAVHAVAGPLAVATTAVVLLVVARLRGTVAVRRYLPPSPPAALAPPGPFAVVRVVVQPAIVRAARLVSPWVLALAVVAGASNPFALPVAALVVPAVLAAAALVALHRPPRGASARCRRRGLAPFGRRERSAWRAAAVAAVFALSAVAAGGSWLSRPTALVGGGVVLALLLAARRAVPVAVGPWLVALGYGYALIVLGVGLSWADFDPIAVPCGVSGVAALVALICTRVRRISRTTWWAVLATTAVPFLGGVATLLDERSWWSAGAAAMMLGLELVLVTTARDGAAPWLRGVAALTALPTAAVVVVSLGAMLVPGSASPIVLPVVAVLTAATLLAAAPAAARSEEWAPGSGRWVRTAVEGSALLSGAGAILLAAVRTSAGADTAVIVLAVLAAGTSGLAGRRDRRRAWWVAAALWVAAWWTLLGWAGVGVVETYTLPPAVVALGVGAWLAWGSPRWWGLAVGGAVLGVAPSLVVLAAGSGGAGGSGGVRLGALTATAVLGVAGAEVLRRRSGTWMPGGAALAAGTAVLAAMCGPVQVLSISLRGPAMRPLEFWSALAWSLGSALVIGWGVQRVTGALRVTDRRWAWWPAGLLWVALSWTVLGAARTTVVEAYTLTPAVVAVVAGVWLARRSPRWWALAVGGVALGAAPSLAVLGAASAGQGGARLGFLAIGALVALVGAEAVRRRRGAWAQGGTALAAGTAVLAALCGPVHALSIAGQGPAGGSVAFWSALAWSLGSALVVGRGTRRAMEALERADRGWVAGIVAGLWVLPSWVVLGAAGIGAVEAYTLLPAVVAVAAGAWWARRSPRFWALAAGGVVLGVVPSLAVLAAGLAGPGEVRAWALAGTAVAGLALAGTLRRREDDWAHGVTVLAAGTAVLAATGGLLHALWTAADGSRDDVAVFWSAFVWSLGTAAAAGLGGAQLAAVLRRRPGRWADVVQRWWSVPALAIVSLGSACGVRPGWGPALTLWALELGLLVLTVATVGRTGSGRAVLPPAWLVWLAALTVAIGGWSTRELFRVEVFSVPLGVGLLAAGWLVLRRSLDGGVTPAGVTAPAPRRWEWPVGSAGSWRTLAPGFLALLGPSILATTTDPLTWRAVLVVALALLGVLAGTQRHLAAPFVLGVAVLPVEILVVFASQLDTRIDASTWMLTLGAAGGLLLIIATHYERRIAKFGGASAYVRDLR